MEKHIRGGLTDVEAIELNLPVKDYKLHSLEEQKGKTDYRDLTINRMISHPKIFTKLVHKLKPFCL